MSNISVKENIKYAAVIVSAGMSSRMGAFKPLLPIGNKSAIRRIIDTFTQCGVEEIIIVGGNKAEELRKHLNNFPVKIVMNEEYSTSKMFDSACIGFRCALNLNCDRVFFTPVDIPLFSTDTVKTLMDSTSKVVYPVSANRRGHPILLNSEVIDYILTDSGEGGLKAAIRRSNVCIYECAVSDDAILMDMDTPQDYGEIKEYVKNKSEQKGVL